MGEVRIKAKFVNPFDVHARRRKIRQIELDCLVDTGAVLSYLPGEVVEFLGIPTAGNVIVRYADERREELPKAGPLRIAVAGREGNFDCIVGPPNCEPLLGQIVLEELDLVLDPAGRSLCARPESPLLPLLKTK
jgi:hypothetical protein